LAIFTGAPKGELPEVKDSPAPTIGKENSMAKDKQPKVSIQFTKIKCLEGGKTIHLEWQHLKGKTTEKQSLETQEPALPGFQRALDNLTAHVQEIMNLPKTWMKSVKVLGVSLDWKNGIMGAVITFRKEGLAGEKGTTINTPHYPASPYQEGAPEVNLLPGQCVIDIGELIDQADAYRLGERAQADMFPDEAKPGTGGSDDIPE
jgi:hypothetical protein